jgi:hypothetical protein
MNRHDAPGHALGNEPVQLAGVSVATDSRPDLWPMLVPTYGGVGLPVRRSRVFEQPRMGGRTPPSSAEPSIDDTITG